MKTVFFVPVFNQIEEFPTVLRELKETSLPCETILLINNGSTDGSETLIRESGYDYIDLPENLGVGHAFMVAIDWALERGYEVLGGLAGNAKMLPSEMHRLVEPIYNGSADYVTGSRFLIGGDSPNLPRFRKTSIPLVNIVVKFLTSTVVTDATCGYRAYKLDIFRRAEFNWHAPWLNTYGFEYYLYAKVLLDGSIRWIEVPVTMRYPGKGKRYSKIKPFKGWWEMIKPWLIARIDGKGFSSADLRDIARHRAPEQVGDF